MTGLESTQDVLPESATVGTGSCDPSGGNDHESSTATHESDGLVAAYGGSLGGFGQIPDPAYAINLGGFGQITSQAIVKDIIGAEEGMSNVESISGPEKIRVNAIGSARAIVGKLDSIGPTRLQSLSTFKAVVAGIVNVCLSNNDVPSLTIMRRSTHTLKWHWMPWPRTLGYISIIPDAAD